MLKWLRNAGDSTRLDQEIQRTGVRPSAFPLEMRKQLVQVVQNHVDLARHRHGLGGQEFQEFFDQAFGLAAIIPTVVGTDRKMATECAGKQGYALVVNLVRDESPSLYGDLVKALYATCKPWMQQPNNEFLQALKDTTLGEDLADPDIDEQDDSDRELYIFEQLGAIATEIIASASHKNDLDVAMITAASIVPMVAEAKNSFQLEVQEGSALSSYLQAVSNQDLVAMAGMARLFAEELKYIDGTVLRGAVIYFWFTGE